MRASSAGPSSLRPKATGHMLPSSSRARSVKPGPQYTSSGALYTSPVSQ